MTTIDIDISSDGLKALFGTLDENARLIEKGLRVSLKPEDGALKIIGEPEDAARCETLVRNLLSLSGQGYELDRARVLSAVDLVLMDKPDDIISLSVDAVAVTAKGKQIKAKSIGQRNYVRAIKRHTLVFGVGPAGTGKTYLAVALAVMAFKAGEADKIILTRPAIEAGEKLGFLPGDLQMKVDPYLRPLYDALQEMFGIDSYLKLIERGIIEIAPLAYMRGRTLSRSFIILDEAQNTTNEQMKMFLTRLGEGSKAVVTGDVTQVDLPEGKKSGLNEAIRILKGIDGIDICRLTDRDIVRHELVQRIVLAYERAEHRRGDNNR
ncbi:MAG: PhoH family protein [Clostridiales bacterium]|jgi:phosphate starvation-inducible PhoH-like protein|nr:PhoH family protein [Clostridiales bacterium]